VRMASSGVGYFHPFNHVTKPDDEPQCSDMVCAGVDGTAFAQSTTHDAVNP
jgi:hypothetical protein